MKFLAQILLFACLTVPMSVRADFGDRAFNWSASESEDFRDYAVRALNRQQQLINDPWLNFWLEQTFLQLNLASQRPIGPTLILPIRDDSINAFAMPGNLIGIHSGLWLAAQSEDELASVIAHEMAHISLDHFTRISQDSNRQSLALASGILLSILLAAENPEAANAALLSSFAMTQQNQLNFSRAMETEADQLAQRIIDGAAMDPDAGRRFFRRLDSAGNTARQLEFLRSHPLGETRASNLGGQFGDVETESPSNPVFRIMTIRLNQTLTPNEKISQLTELLSRIPTQDIEQNPHLRFLAIELGRDSEKEAYIDKLTSMTELFPAFIPAHLRILETALSTSDTTLCRFLNPALKQTEHQYRTIDALEVFNNMAQLCGHASRDRLHAQKLWQSGREEAALQFLKARLNQSLDTSQSALLNNLLEQYSQRYARFN